MSQLTREDFQRQRRSVPDLHALTDALASIDRMGRDQVVCCGDLVDWGLFPDETITLLRERGIP